MSCDFFNLNYVWNNNESFLYNVINVSTAVVIRYIFNTFKELPTYINKEEEIWQEIQIS